MRRGIGSALAAAVCLAAAPSAVVAQELRGRVRETYQRLSVGGEEADTVLQNYEVNYRADVTSSVYWQARLRALLTGLDQEGSGASASDTQLLEPFLQVVYQGPAWQLSGGARLASESPRGDPRSGTERDRRDYFGRAAWGREDLPEVNWSVWRMDLDSDRVTSVEGVARPAFSRIFQRVESDAHAVQATTEDRSLLTASWSRAPGSLSLGLENRWFADEISDFTRTSIQTTANGDLRRAFSGGRVTLGGQALLFAGRITEETPAALDVDVQRRPRRGLSATDTTPLSGTLGDAPGLVDGDLAAPAADLGGDFRNLGAEFGFAETVDTIFVYVERRLLPGNDREYAWDVYTSGDGEFWSLQTAGAAASFDGLQNRFEIRLAAPATARWFKVVDTDFSRDEPPLAATEIQLFGREKRTGRERSSQGRQSGNVHVTWRAADAVDVSFSSFASRQTNDAGGSLRADEDLNSTLTTTVRAGADPGAVTTTVRLQAVDRSTTLGRPESDRLAAVTLAGSPVKDLDLSATGTHRRNTSYGDLVVDADSLSLRGGARILADLEAAVDLGVIRQREGVIGRTTTRRNAHVTFVTTLRPGLVFSNDWGVERVAFGDAAGTESGRIDLDLRSRLSYRPTRVLGAAVEYFHQEIAGRRGSSRLYDLDWLPFPGGALQLQMSLRQDRRSVTGSLRDESRAGARWTINPKTLLDVAYTVIRIGDGSVERQEVISAFLEYRF